MLKILYTGIGIAIKDIIMDYLFDVGGHAPMEISESSNIIGLRLR